MTKDIEKTETETHSVGFETIVIPNELFCGFMRYSVREDILKAMRCFNCQEVGHVVVVCKGKRSASYGDDHEYGRCGEVYVLLICIPLLLALEWVEKNGKSS